MTNSKGSTLKLALWLLLSVGLLNFALSFHNLWPTPWVTVRGELSIEIAITLLTLSAYSEWRGVPARRWLYAMSIVIMLFTIGRYAEVTAPALFGRRINIYWDAQHLPRVVAMFAESAPAWTVAVTLAGVCTALLTTCALLHLSVTHVWTALAHKGARRTLAFASAICVATYVIALQPGDKQLLRWFSLPVSATYLQQARFIHDALNSAAVTASLNQAPLPQSNLQQVHGADVMLMFLESYGATAFDEAQFQAPLRSARSELAAAIETHGLRVASAFLTSPTFGGASWLAHSTLMSGIKIEDEPSYAMLLTRKRDTLAQRFAQRGYRTLALMPGLKQSWPEGGFYDFEQIYDEKALAYQGPAFGWWRIPDQFALARFDVIRQQRNKDKPLFVFFPTTSTHMPFRPTPPYQRDWSRMMSAQPFDDDDVQRSLATPARWADLRPDYAAALAYGLTTIAGYLTKNATDVHATRDLLLIVVGDHQPPASVSGEAASHDVPIHVITSRTNIIKALLAAGFTRGLNPPRRALMRMHELTPLLLQVFAAP